MNRTGFPITFDDARTAYLLAILGLQNGDYELLQTMMGRYLALSAVLHLHDESSWPDDLTALQIQERRVLVWPTPSRIVVADFVDDQVLVCIHDRRVHCDDLGWDDPSPRQQMPGLVPG